MNSTDRAQFRRRQCCIACRSTDFTILSSGKFSDDPVRKFIEHDPWGVNPLPFLQDQPWEFVRCVKCGQMFHAWILAAEWQEIRFTQWMSEAAIREFERTRGRDQPTARWQQGVSLAKHILQIEKLTRSIRGTDPVRLLDFGCGWGELLDMAGQFGFQSCGVDRSAARLRVSSDRGVRVVPDLDAAGNGFHAVTLFQVLEHIEEPLDLLVSLGQRMVAGAVLVLEVPNCAGVTGMNSSADYYNIHPLDHINCFTPQSLRALAERAGFVAGRAPYAEVTADAADVFKGELKRIARKFKPRSTNQYFTRRERS